MDTQRVPRRLMAVRAMDEKNSQASPERDALKACARAFASSLASPGAVLTLSPVPLDVEHPTLAAGL
jgi:hypothetical protein